MTLKLEAKTPPLTADADGVVKVSGTRVTLDTVVYAFREGATAEEIVIKYPSLDLADVYATVAYYLQHQQETEAYLATREEAAARVRHEAEARFDPKGIRDRLLARLPKSSLSQAASAPSSGGGAGGAA